MTLVCLLLHHIYDLILSFFHHIFQGHHDAVLFPISIEQIRSREIHQGILVARHVPIPSPLLFLPLISLFLLGGFPSHVNAETPGAIHEGGELGYALSVAYGSIMDKPDLIAIA
jgi:hypothetical protein